MNRSCIFVNVHEQTMKVHDFMDKFSPGWYVVVWYAVLWYVVVWYVVVWNAVVWYGVVWCAVVFNCMLYFAIISIYF